VLILAKQVHSDISQWPPANPIVKVEDLFSVDGSMLGGVDI